MSKVINTVAMTFVAAFAGVWLWIVWKVWHYEPTATAKLFEMSTPLTTTAGFLAATVGAGTAAVLGITVAKVTSLADGVPKALTQRLNDAATDSPLLMVGILVYFFVGIATLLVWIANPDEAPSAINTFALGTLGWAGGAFSSVFKAKV